MNRKVILISLFISYFNLAFTQTNKSYIITNEKDTLRNIKIIKKYASTNFNQVSFINHDGNVQTIKSEDIHSYFDGENKFLSKTDITGKKKKLMSHILIGPLTLGESKNSKGETIFFLKKVDKQGYVCLEEYKFKLNDFISSYLADYQEFKLMYRKKIYYNTKSLGEFVSAYNEYQNPELYRYTKFKNTEALQIGSYISLNLMSTINNDDFSKIFIFNTFALGMLLENSYSNNLVLNFKTLFNSSRISTKEDKFTFYKIDFEPALMYKIKLNDKAKLVFGPGLIISYCFNTKNSGNAGIIKSEQEEVKGLIFGYKLSTEFELFNKASLTLAYVNQKVIVRKKVTKSISPEDKITKYNLSGLRIGLAYKF